MKHLPRNSTIIWQIILVLTLLTLPAWAELTPKILVFEDDFESGPGWWSFEGVWDLGSPTANPVGGFESANCVGTVIDGDYPAGADARLISPPIAIPVPLPGEGIFLSFANWFALGAGDVVLVEISTDNKATWDPIGAPFSGYSPNWTHYLTEIDGSYAGQTVSLAFHIVDNGSATGNTHGFFVDDVLVETATIPTMATPTGFETDADGWFAENGSWQIGSPGAGPMAGYGGSASCAGTVLDSEYSRYANGRLVSPAYSIGTPGSGNAMYLTFQHWAALAAQDLATVEVSTDGSTWETVAENLVRADAWQQAFVDISAFSGQTVRFGFHLTDDGGSAINSEGWYIDQVDVVEGPERDWTQLEDFETGIAGWSVDGDVWEIGLPTAGPSGAFGGTHCAGTNLDGSYPPNSSARLVSPPTTLPSLGVDEFLKLSFWHWFQHVDYQDHIDIQIRPEGGSWQHVQRVYSLSSEDWTRMKVDLSAYAEQTIQVGFSLSTDGSSQFFGWYLDDISLVIETASPWSLVDFESGIGGWSSDGGIWEVGMPTAGPDSAFAGDYCAGTNLDNTYDNYANTRLISPPSSLPVLQPGERLVLDFWHWFQHVDYQDHIDIQIQLEDGTWQHVQRVYSLYGEDWTHMTVDITDFAAQTVQIGFYLTTDSSGGWLGWYIDDVNIQVIEPEFWSQEGFENGVGHWGSNGGLWEVGLPTSGPNAVFEGASCAATNLDGNYPPYTDARFISPFNALPDTSDILLSFWQWFSHVDWSDNLYIDIKGDDGNWVQLHRVTSLYTENWSRALIDVSDYRGQTVQFAFRIYTNSESNSPGWYVDEIQILLGQTDSWTECDFEEGIDGWSMDNGIWQIGIPTSGPGTARSGQVCAATNLAGNYEVYADSRLISPPTQLNPTPEDGVIQISFWQWFNHIEWGNGFYLQVRTAIDESKTNWNAWETVYTQASLYSDDWTKARFDISNYAGEIVQFAWYIKDNNSGHVYPGWFIDDVVIKEGITGSGGSDSILFDFEDNQVEYGGWSTDNGCWQVGEPESGPVSNMSGRGHGCAGTNLDGNYHTYADTRFISPPIILAAPHLPSADGNYWLSFWQWISRSTWADYLDIDIRVDDGDWTRLHRVAPLYATDWSRSLVDLTAFAGHKIQVGFYLNDDNAGGEAAGWYLDDIEVFSGAPALLSPDNFANSDWARVAQIGGWGADNGCWVVGEPDYVNGPDGAFEGEVCAGTVMDGNYLNTSNSRFISPPLALPSAPLENQIWFSFWHWYDFYPSDNGSLEVSVDGGDWTQISKTFTYSSGGWTQQIVDLADYLGHTVRLAFHIQDNNSYASHTAAGWYIDKVSLVEGPKLFNNPEGFESRTKGWSADAGSWQIGEPLVGPESAYSGAWCVGTVLDGNYPRYVDSRVVSPSITLGPAPMVRLRQWFNLAAGDEAIFEISSNGEPWEELDTFTTIANWTQYVKSLAAYAGQEVRVAFRLKDNGDASQAEGWYIDELEFLDVPTGAPEAPLFHDVTYSTGGPVLTWEVNAPDHSLTAIYAGHMLSFEPDPVEDYTYTPDFSNRIQLTTATSYTDDVHPFWRAGYMISSINDLWQESELVGPTTLTEVGDGQLVRRTELNQNWPNPFNPMTTIWFDLSASSTVSLSVFDVGGHLVRELIAEEKMEIGRHKTLWDGRDKSGRTVAAGVYFYQLKAGAFTETKSMTLVK